MRSLVRWTLICTVFVLSFTVAVECASGSNNDRPQYYQVFSTHQHWEGTYTYNSSLQYCYLFINSEHYLKKNGLLATFRDRDGATIELEGDSPGQNELEVKFSVHVMFHPANRFPVNFTLQGILSQDSSSSWLFKAVMTPKGLFGPFVFFESSRGFGPPLVKDDGKSGKYFFIIGLPIILAVIGVAGTIALLYWGVRKGYIRHVPKSYDTFHNDPVRYENSEDGETRNVHM